MSHIIHFLLLLLLQGVTTITAAPVVCEGFTVTSEITPVADDGKACQIIEGDLIIVAGKFTNLVFLNKIIEVTGNVELTSLEFLTYVDDLRLVTIGGSLIFGTDLDAIVELDIPTLKTIGTSLSFASKFVEYSIPGFNQLTKVKSISFTGGGGTELKSITGFNKLKSIDGTLYLLGQSSLEDFSGFKNLQKVTKDIVLSNFLVKNLDNFKKLKTVGGKIEISDMNDVKSITLDKLQIVYGSLKLRNLVKLEKLGLKRLKAVYGQVQFIYNDELESICSMSKLNRVGSLSITEWPGDDITSLEQLKTAIKDGSCGSCSSFKKKQCKKISSCMVLNKACADFECSNLKKKGCKKDSRCLHHEETCKDFSCNLLEQSECSGKCKWFGSTCVELIFKNP